MGTRLGTIGLVSEPFDGWFRDRRVLVTGHTGFTGSWLCQWLLELGARVSGFALAPPPGPSLFELLGLAGRIDHALGDVRDDEALAKRVRTVGAELILHLAAQPLVRASYDDPRGTWSTNVMGTVNVLEAARSSSAVIACVVITSDKCYQNSERPWPYRESDRLGGGDPYSSSKAAAELAAASWRASFAPDGAPRIATARAGNIIGGGDWSADRLIPDFVRAVEENRALALRHPHATRPWQHVLDAIGGYLQLARHLAAQDGARYAQAWNIGPAESEPVSVDRLAREFLAAYGAGSIVHSPAVPGPREANSLQLDCSKTRIELGWHARWPVREAVQRTAAWYRGLRAGAGALELTRRDIDAYVARAGTGNPVAPAA